MIANFNPYPRQQEFIDSIFDEDGPQIAVVATGRQIGKDLRNDSILYYDGYTSTIGECRVGDSIYGDNGKLTTILAKYPQGIKSQYQVVLEDGRTIQCGLEHQHQIITNQGVVKNVDTQYLIDNKCSILTAKPVEYSEKKHLIPPYAMGIFISEGSPTFIPEDYLFDSIENRIELLKGLVMDGNMEYYTYSDRLTIEFLNLVRSLGLKATSVVIKKNGLDCNRISYSNQDRTEVIGVKQIDDAESTCITVDNESSCFLTDNYTITHNTLSGIYITLKWAFKYPGETILVIQPDSNYLNKLLMQYKRALLPLEKAKLCTINKSTKIIEFANGAIIDMQSALSEGAGRGTSSSLIWFDEAAFVDDNVFYENVMPTAAVTGRKILLTSTPFGQKGFFWDMHISPETLSFAWPSIDNPYLSIKFLRLMKTLTPPDSYDQEYKGKFLEGGGSVFSNISENSTIIEWISPKDGIRYFAGIDWGNLVDKSVLTIMDEDGNVVFIRSMSRTKYELIATQFAKDLKYYNNALAYSENNSIGETANDYLDKDYHNYRRVTLTGSQSKDISLADYDKPLSIGKPKLITELIISFNGNLIKLPTAKVCPDLNYELRVFTFKLSPGTNGLKYEAPPGKHDDHVISLAYANLCRLHNINAGAIEVYTYSYDLDDGMY